MIESSNSILTPTSWRDEKVSRLILGTVQLGVDYGIANTQGKPDRKKAAAIIETAWAHGIRHFDTAQAYGDSESVLGRLLDELGLLNESRICSKLSATLDLNDTASVTASIERTFENLRTDRLWCMMFHRASGLDPWEDGVGELLLEYRDAKRIEHLGVSLNSPAEAEVCLAHSCMEVLQVACNAWDRRMPRLNVFETAQRRNKLCCVRSIYLQGLLTMPPSAVATRLPQAHEAALRWNAFARRLRMTTTELAVRFSLTLDVPLVVGAESPEQIAETALLVGRGPLSKEEVEALAETLDPVVNDTVLTPSRWEEQHNPRSEYQL